MNFKEFKDLENELIAANITHALDMGYLRVTDVLIKNNDLQYELYQQLQDEVKHELNRLKVELIKQCKERP